MQFAAFNSEIVDHRLSKLIQWKKIYKPIISIHLIHMYSSKMESSDGIYISLFTRIT